MLKLSGAGLGLCGSLGVFLNDELYNLVSNGTIVGTRLNDKVARVLTPLIAHGQLDNPLAPVSINSFGIPNAPIIY